MTLLTAFGGGSWPDNWAFRPSRRSRPRLFVPAVFTVCLRPGTRRRALIAEAREGLRCFRDWRRDLVAAHDVGPLPLIDTFTNPEAANLCYLPRELQPYAEAPCAMTTPFCRMGPCAPASAPKRFRFRPPVVM